MRPLSFLGILGLMFLVMIVWTVYDVRKGDSESLLLWLPLLVILIVWASTEAAEKFPKSKLAQKIKSVMEWIKGGL